MKTVLQYLTGFVLIYALLIQTAAAGEVKVFAAVSLSNVLQELAKGYEAESGDRLVFNFAGSNALARQIKESAPADVFLSADEAQMNGLAKADLLAADTRFDLLSNTLVIIAPKDSALTITSAKDLAGAAIKRLALAEPKAVPAGVYAKEYLEKIGIWKDVEAKVIPTENVRAALAAVDSGNADAGIVYKTDAGISKNVKIAFEIPVTEGSKIVYPVALMKEAANAEGAKKFLAYLKTRPARDLFTRYGFVTLAR